MKEFHEVSNIFPLLQGKEYEELKADIAANGLIEDIWLSSDGKIIDGRNRYKACMDVGIEPRFRIWEDRGSIALVNFVVSLNLHRRHLSSGQRAMIAVEAEDILTEFEKEAKDRQLATLKQGDAVPVQEIIPEREKGQARDQVATLFKTNGKYVDTAKKLKDEAPDLAEQVKDGTLEITKAAREYTHRTKKTPEPIKGKYRVIYADPPWKYNDNGLDDYGHAERHYPPMAITELCELKIEDIAEKDSVLFLWVTSPLLESAFKIIKAWGFKYKTSFVWDKVKHNYGHYNSVRHEFLLVCTKGSCTPDTKKLYDSVQTVERSGNHSEKPEVFREIIDTLYTQGKKIELFARKKTEKWESWGNEIV